MSIRSSTPLWPVVATFFVCLAVILIIGFSAGSEPESKIKADPEVLLDQQIPERFKRYDRGEGRVIVVRYRGHDLYCITLRESYAGDRSCDFTRYYAEHPEVLHDR